ncbi:MAG TPA: acyl-CoA thioesterase domain-containing protein [Ferrovibrio sp.]|uniref:PaaI family thioesterase n=1 Tax=Ferrovibrio sp. TaxID=1917215 RepID=UPI002B4B2F8F|nr:acyl-CoA thioesterase domain-containing protein [Ferrovibrio sp.]HLT79241.1 acyl-CoA thioesterase domain-containing protein [Ferrovibrio sp.]
MQMTPIEQGLARVLGGRIAHDDEIGVRYSLSADGRRTMLDLPFAPFLTEAGADHIGIGPLATVLDSACGIGAMVALGFRESTATVDLRIDYLRDLSPGVSCQVEAGAVDVGGQPEAGMVMMRAEARDKGTNAIIAHATGQFIRRRLPEGDLSAEAPPPAATTNAPDYRSLMGFVSEPAGLRMPFRPGLVGNGSLPSLHGGAIAAHMQQAACEALDTGSGRRARLTTAHFSFLRFAGGADTVASSVVERVGASVASVRVTSSQPPDRVVARGVFTFFRT